MTTGNTERDAMLVKAIKQCGLFHDEPTFENVREKLPKDFDLLEEEYTSAMQELQTLATVAPSHRVTESVAEAPADERLASQALPQAPRDAPVISQAQARAAVEAAHIRLGAARVRVRIAQQTLQDTNGKLATSIEAWRHNEDPLTPEQRQAREHRAYLASELARKQGLADIGERPNRMRTDKFMVDMQTGGRVFKGGSRGAFPANMQNRAAKIKGEA